MDKNEMISNEEFKDLNKKIDEANNYVMKSNYEMAKKITNEYLNIALNLYKEDETTRYFTCKDVIQFNLAKENCKIQKKIVWIDLRIDDAYQLLAHVAYEENNFSKAIEYLEQGLYFNPMNMEIRFKYTDLYLMQKDLDKMYKSIIEIYEYIYNPSMLARYYRLLGYYYIEKQNYDLAYSLYAISIYYENNEIAHREIFYIKTKTGNPNFEKTTMEILDLLKKQNIPTTISQKNLNQLRNLSEEKQLFEKQPILMGYLNEVINIFTNQINESTKIKGLKVTNPKITSEEIFDDNKITLDDKDKIRIEKNINLLKEQNIPFKEHMKAIPFNSCTNLRSKEEAINRMLVDYTIATCALYSLEGKAAIIPSILKQMDEKLKIKTILSPGDINFLNVMSKQNVSKPSLQNATWLFEECAMLMWTLSLIDKPNSDKECNVEQIDEFFFNIKTYDELLSKCNLKSKEEILEEADLLFRYHWACHETRMQGKPLPQLNEMIVQEQRCALEWILNWNFEKLMKDKINIKYERDNFNFNFNVSTQLYISNITNPQDDNLLLALSDNRGRIIISMSDLGRELVCSRDAYFENDMKKIKLEGWNIIGTYYLSSTYIEGGFKQIVINKEMLPSEDKKIGLCIYYFTINNHVVVLKTVLDDSLDYSNINNILKSKHNLLAMDILSSIKENSFNDEKVQETKSINSLDEDIRNNYEKVLNDILPGLTMYARDVNLDKKLEDKYIPNTIILERGFTDATVRIMGMKTTHRFVILSNHMVNVSQVVGDNRGLCVAQRGSRFLILDKYVYNGKIQILLLHLPDDDRWKMFQNVKLNILDNVIIDCRKRFESKCELEVVPELSTDEWLKRCSAPLGMDDNGNLFDLNEGSLTGKNNIEICNKEEEKMSYEHINEDEISIINNEYDYSTVIPTIDAVAYLVQYCDNIYKNFIALTDEDEKRNQQFKQEFKNYTFKKVYSDRFVVYIRDKHYNTITYKDFGSFQSAVNNGNLTNVNSLEIQLKMDFKRGNGNELVEYENSFSIVFKHYDIKFTRISNHNELKMNQIENSIRDILNKFQTVNTIFCTK